METFTVVALIFNIMAALTFWIAFLASLSNDSHANKEDIQKYFIGAVFFSFNSVYIIAIVNVFIFNT